MRRVDTVIAALERRRSSDGSAPLLTWYGDGQRVELSGTTLANWVDKTVNLLVSMGLDEEPTVAAPLLFGHPAHWTSLVWAMAVWQIGGLISVEPREDVEDVDLAVVGPTSPHPLPGVETVACSLDPWGRGFEIAPPGVTDYHEVLSQPDVHWISPRATSHSWWRDGRGELTGAQLSATPPQTHRAVVRPADARESVLNALVAPLLGGGSSVLVSPETAPGEVERIAAQERALLEA